VRVGVWYRIHDDVDIRSLRSCTLEENRLVDLWFLVLNPWRHLVSDYTLEIIVKYFWFWYRIHVDILFVILLLLGPTVV
jgi:hypothetical protein